MRLREINNVQFFLNWLNERNRTDYKIDTSFNEENSPIDVVAKSNKTGKILNIQNTAYREGNVYVYGQSNIPNIRPVGVLGVAMNVEQKKESILKCINSKSSKYPKSVVEDLILIVEVTIPFIRPEEIKEMFKDNYKSDFKGIYFVQLPVTLANIENKYEQVGYVYPLKDCIRI